MPGLLDNVRQKIGGLLSEAASVRELFSGRVGGQTLEQGIQNRLQPNSLRPALSPKQMVDAGMNIVGMAPLGMTVWHGSPHKFDKFDMSKIGTGEGAQAYGHGLYFAESPEVAKTYGMVDIGKNKEFRSVTYGGQTYPQSDPMAHSLFEAASQGRAPVIQKLQAQADRLSSINPAMAKKLEEKIAFLKTVNPDKVQIEAGNMYKVDIPDEAVARFLDWDKPLSQQAPEVQQGILKAGLVGPKHRFATDDLLAGDFIKGLRPEDQKLLYSQGGIPGIRYLDGGSSTAGTGTSNFVLFDDQLPRILERNGVPTGLQPWLPGEWGGL